MPRCRIPAPRRLTQSAPRESGSATGWTWPSRLLTHRPLPLISWSSLWQREEEPSRRDSWKPDIRDASLSGVRSAIVPYACPPFHPYGDRTRGDADGISFVHHYGDPAKERNDPKYLTDQGGVWYPRAGTLGGCTSHNALIFVYPSNHDWNQLADLTGDASWRAEKMRTYFERLEDCRHRRVARFRHKLGVNPSRHGFNGWLPVEKAAPAEAIGDGKIRRLFAASIRNAVKEVGLPSLSRLESLGDPNDWRVISENEFGACYTPMTTRNYQRVGARERLLDVRKQYPDRLTIELNALATRVIFDDRKRAVGVEYLKGERLYQAHATPSEQPASRGRFARGARSFLPAASSTRRNC
jgi:choline dehydrogenase-like flavoprotein